MYKIQILKIKLHLLKGGIIAYPTESCYGLGCLPSKVNAVKQIIKIKKRNNNKGFIIIGNNLSQFKTLIQKISPTDNAYLNSVWPAAKTFLLTCKPNINPLLKEKKSFKIAVRIPDHELARNICKQIKNPLVSTSANISKKKPCRNFLQVKKVFKKNIIIIPGKIGTNKKPSQLIDLKSKNIIRK